MANLKDYKAPKPTKVEKFLWWCCGADKQIMVESTYADYAKYSGLGGIVFATGILAFLAMSFAMYRVFLNEDGSNEGLVMFVAVIIGLLWGAIIFNLDRFIVSSTGKGDGSHDISWKELIHALPRVLMAGLIGITISGPLEVYIFQKEIDKQWEDIKLVKITAAQIKADTIKIKEYSEFEQKLAGLIIDKDQIKARIAEIEPKIDYQIEHGGCRGKCEALKRERDLKLSQLEKIEADILIQDNGKKAILAERQVEVEKTKTINSGKLGILDSLSALHAYPGSFWPSWLLRLLFVFIEIAPVFFKLMIAYSPYDYLSDNLKFIKLANQGIEAKQGYTKLENGDIHDQVVYHEAESIFRQTKSKLTADESIYNKIVDQYKQKEEGNINTNPNDYIKPE